MASPTSCYNVGDSLVDIVLYTAFEIWEFLHDPTIHIPTAVPPSSLHNFIMLLSIF